MDLNPPVDYERINQVQTGVISPTKLRLKLLGANFARRKEGLTNSSKTSPNKSPDMMAFAKNSLLPPPNTVTVEEYGKSSCSGMAHSAARTTGEEEKEKDGSMNFEFHNGNNHPLFSRPLPSKWNDAEKWIFRRRATYSNILRKSTPQSQANCAVVAPEKVGPPPSSGTSSEKFSFAPVASVQTSESIRTTTCGADFAPTADEKSALSTKPVCMRDMGTEMTPMTSQEASRIGTPVGAETPIRSFESSKMSTPGRDPMPSPSYAPGDNGSIGLSEEEFRLKTRQEIIALGVQLGKMNIAAWARRDQGLDSCTNSKSDDVGNKKEEFETHANAWEEAEKSKHMASFRREEIKIQLWESNRKAKIEAEFRESEARVEKMRSRTQLKFRKKLSRLKHQTEAKLAAAELRKNKETTKTGKQVNNIYQTRRVPLPHFLCYGFQEQLNKHMSVNDHREAKFFMKDCDGGLQKQTGLQMTEELFARRLLQQTINRMETIGL